MCWKRKKKFSVYTRFKKALKEQPKRQTLFNWAFLGPGDLFGLDNCFKMPPLSLALILSTLSAFATLPTESAVVGSASRLKQLPEEVLFGPGSVTELFGNSGISCNNQVLPLKALFPSKSDFLGNFTVCPDVSTSSEAPLDRLCISTVYNLRYVCEHQVKAEPEPIAESKINSFESKQLCDELTKSAAPIPTCHDRPCNVSSATAFEFKQVDRAKQLCDACMKNQTTQ